MSRPWHVPPPLLPALIEPGGTAGVRVLSPGVGWWWPAPRQGALIGEGSRIGTLERHNRTFALVLPAGAAGRVAGELPADRRVPVEFRQPLFELRPVADAEVVAVAGAATDPAADLAEGTWPVLAPTDGVFYRRPAPDVPPFVEVGARVRPGQPVGLVEAMKTFNQIVYGGPGLPEEAEVIEIRCGDAEEVRSGQVLLVVR